MEDLFTSEAWKNATPHQRREFLSKVRADKQVEKEAKKKLEAQKKIEAKPATPPKQSKASKKRSRQAGRRIKLQGAVRTTYPSPTRPTLVAGVDVTTDAFLSTFQWRKVRMEALKKYGPRCQCCGATPADGAVMNVDHIKPRKKWPSLALDVNNLQILCHDCNHGKGNWDDTDWRS